MVYDLIIAPAYKRQQLTITTVCWLFFLIKVHKTEKHLDDLCKTQGAMGTVVNTRKRMPFE